MITLFRLVVLCCLAYFAPAAFAPAWAEPSPMQILSINATVEIGVQDRITVTEEIVAHLPTDGTNQGLFREIPINSRWQDPNRRHVKLTVESVLLDGREVPTDDIQINFPSMRIYMRDTSSYLNAGTHTFTLRYVITQQIGFFEKNDELTWNIVGSGWNGVAASQCLVIPPPGTNFTNQDAWIGTEGAKDSPVEITAVEADGRSALLFKATRSMDAGESFTFAVAWPKGIVQPPSNERPSDAPWLTPILILLLLATISFCGWMWYRYGKDPVPGPVIPMFYPPKLPARLTKKKGRQDKMLSAAAVNYIWNKAKLDSHGLAGLLVEMAQKKACAIDITDEGKSYRLSAGKTKATTCPEEADVLKAINKKTIVIGDGGEDYDVHKVTEACKKSLSKDYADQWQDNLFLNLLNFLLPLVVLGAFLYIHVDHLITADDVATLIAFSVFMGIFLIPLLTNIVDLYKNGITFWKVFSVLILLPVCGGFCFLMWLGIEESIFWTMLNWLFTPTQLLIILAIVAVPFLFAPFMDTSTVEASKLRQDINGLRLYIGAAEVQRLNMANPSEEPLTLYHRLLPYAVALGLEKAWGARFAEEISKAQEINGAASGSSLLYTSSLLSGLATTTESSLHSYQASVSSSSSSSSGGSSFSSGGGGAGFGGGGGGGGWC